jgi:hypothetical protein
MHNENPRKRRPVPQLRLLRAESADIVSSILQLLFLHRCEIQQIFCAPRRDLLLINLSF